MTKRLMGILCALFFASSLHAAVTLDYINHDPVEYTMKVVIKGKVEEVTFLADTSGTVTIPGRGSKCVILHECGEFEAKSGMRVKIKAGCVSEDEEEACCWPTLSCCCAFALHPGDIIREEPRILLFFLGFLGG